MRLPKEWTETDILSLINNRVKESLELDYKACDALQKTDAKKREVSKDVSAFANSAGGVIIYGCFAWNSIIPVSCFKVREKFNSSIFKGGYDAGVSNLSRYFK